MRTEDPRHYRWLRRGVFVASCAPALALVWRGIRAELGANPIEAITHETGEWALRLLTLALAVTPLRRALEISWITPLRRTFGLLAFFYASLHFFTFVALDHFFDWDLIVEDVLERRHVSAGFGAYCILALLAAASTKAMARRLGRRWRQLHQLIYPAALLSALHFIWLVKADLREPLVYAAIIVSLLAWRIRHRAE